jgi:hypothetical protein
MNAVPSQLVIPDSYRSNFGPFYLHSPHAFLSRCSLCSPAVRSRIFRAPFPGRIPFRASPLRCRLANASGRIEFNIVLFMDWSFASGCSQPRLSTTQLPSATNRPVLLSDGDFHPTIGAYSQAHIYSRFAANYPTTQKAEVFPLLKRKLGNREAREAWPGQNGEMDNRHKAGTTRLPILGKG